MGTPRHCKRTVLSAVAPYGKLKDWNDLEGAGLTCFGCGRRWSAAMVVVAAAVCLNACSFATKMVANSLTSGGSTLNADNDPELVRDAAPFALKTYESLLESLPKHVPLLLATCRGFTSYAYGFLTTDADKIRYTDRPAAKAIDE